MKLSSQYHSSLIPLKLHPFSTSKFLTTSHVLFTMTRTHCTSSTDHIPPSCICISILWLEKLLLCLQSPTVIFHIIFLHDSRAVLPSPPLGPYLTLSIKALITRLIQQQVKPRDENVRFSLSLCPPPPARYSDSWCLMGICGVGINP